MVMKGLAEYYNQAWTPSSERTFVTPLNELKEFLFYVQEVGVFSTYPQYFTEREGLNSFLILHTSNGEGRLVYEGKEHVLKKGTVFFIDCTKKHRYFNGSKEHWDFQWVHFNGVNAQAAFHYFYAQNQGVTVKADGEEVQRCIEELNRVNAEKKGAQDILSFRLLSELLAALFLLRGEPDFTKNTLPEYIVEVLNEIDRSFASKLTLERLAAKFALNPFVLSRNFKKYVGVGLKTYLTQKKISYAKELLRFTDKPIYEIAELLNYENTEYFIALFKRYEGITPLSFRKKWKQQAERANPR